MVTIFKSLVRIASLENNGHSEDSLNRRINREDSLNPGSTGKIRRINVGSTGKIV